MKKAFVIFMSFVTLCVIAAIVYSHHLRPVDKPVGVVAIPPAESFDTEREYLGEVLIVGEVRKEPNELGKRFSEKLSPTIGLARKRAVNSSKALPMTHMQTNLNTTGLIFKTSDELEHALQAGNLRNHDVSEGELRLIHNGKPQLPRNEAEILSEINSN